MGGGAWRTKRLDKEARIPVRAPIYYGRKSISRDGTHTMTFRRDDPSGVSLLVPCKHGIETIEDLKDEGPRALWKAESPGAASVEIGSNWGCVGALFGSDEARETLRSDWHAHFRKSRKQGLSVVGLDGELDLAWPETVTGEPVTLDIILATATLPEPEPPAAQTLADAWLGQNDGRESYFLENVRCGIRTAQDLEVWRCIEAGKPSWLEADDYREAVKILRSEARGS